MSQINELSRYDSSAVRGTYNAILFAAGFVTVAILIAALAIIDAIREGSEQVRRALQDSRLVTNRSPSGQRHPTDEFLDINRKP